ncbi:uncharacterized protein CANTADRAFT_47880 [Suhomyces tanzawaensis NRRL Y-17324]|uniref:Phosphoglycerate mutase n=1 Tax=Suhomyces tanzawaensis NRRL Y-17324 TaxID=984487 RepID=A0A1E4SNZ5_9ASCO|nr:uncharacterized protein CANTADRAFT_47880 [Suhomyces tanzawaensis NRRL Y-17324]ODV81216.1 hypothetical protein CANTADRAFT_47880 [Suhomyces tanzawaensis NRRL Y-17324]
MSPIATKATESRLTAAEIVSYKKELEDWEKSREWHWKFEVVPNQFKQSLDETDDLLFQHLDEHFGVIGSWDDVVNNLKLLNENAPDTECYKILFLSSSAHGYHNLAQEKYGNMAWNETWLKINGDGTIVWGPDPLLTDLGISQAQENRAQWEIERLNNVTKDPNLILPEKWFVSPLRRSIDTLVHTWDGIADLKKMEPIVTENLRATIGVNTCDKRSLRSEIFDSYHKLGFQMSQSLEPNDIYFKDDHRETTVEQALRINEELHEIFGYENQIVSITSHSCSIRAQLLALGHREFAVGAGGMVPVFVKGTRIGEYDWEDEFVLLRCPRTYLFQNYIEEGVYVSGESYEDLIVYELGPLGFAEFVEECASEEGIRYAEALEKAKAGYYGSDYFFGKDDI